jgi:hypothetical protein
MADVIPNQEKPGGGELNGKATAAIPLSDYIRRNNGYLPNRRPFKEAT